MLNFHTNRDLQRAIDSLARAESTTDSIVSRDLYRKYLEILLKIQVQILGRVEAK